MKGNEEKMTTEEKRKRSTNQQSNLRIDNSVEKIARGADELQENEAVKSDLQSLHDLLFDDLAVNQMKGG